LARKSSRERAWSPVWPLIRPANSAAATPGAGSARTNDSTLRSGGANRTAWEYRVYTTGKLWKVLRALARPTITARRSFISMIRPRLNGSSGQSFRYPTMSMITASGARRSSMLP
jgi:hypothetical protein